MEQIEIVTGQTYVGTSFMDSFWDYGAIADVESEVLERFRRQLLVAVHAPALRSRIPAELREANRPLTRADVERIPLLSKVDLRALKPQDLWAEDGESFHLVRGPGGTTGEPVTMCWTHRDWVTLTHAMKRFCKPLAGLGPLRVWNGYNQGHVSGPAFDDLVRSLGGTPIPRYFKASDRDALRDIERMRANALIITPKSGSGKGGSLEDLFALDPNFLSRLGIRALLVSSTQLEHEVLQEVREQGVVTVINFYGSTEAPPAAVSCEIDPTSFHLTQGHVLVEVTGFDGRQVRSGERGMVVVSRVGAEERGCIGPAGGTQLIRYVIGDMATYDEQPCPCGRTSPRISHIVRFQGLEDKLKGGCERWE